MAKATAGAQAPGYNGPSREKFLDSLAEYEERRFEVMRATSLAGKVLNQWEEWGGNKADLRDGYTLRQMDPTEQKAELQRQFRVAGWLGIVDEDATGQRNFLKVFEVGTKTAAVGIGGAPFGSRLSIVRARTAGFADGKTKNGPTMAEGLEVYAGNLGWEPDSDESLAYAQGFGEGFPERPAPKPRKGKNESDGEDGLEEGADGEDAADSTVVALPKRRGRPRKDGRSAVDDMADRAAALDPEGASLKPGWDAKRDFTNNSEIDGPFH